MDTFIIMHLKQPYSYVIYINIVTKYNMMRNSQCQNEGQPVIAEIRLEPQTCTSQPAQITSLTGDISNTNYRLKWYKNLLSEPSSKTWLENRYVSRVLVVLSIFVL